MEDNDYDVSIFVITDEGEYVDEYDFEQLNHDNAKFIMLTNDELNPDYGEDNTILIYTNWQKSSQQVNSQYKCFGKLFCYDGYGEIIDMRIPFQKDDQVIPNDPYQILDDKGLNSEDDKELKHSLNGYIQSQVLMTNVVPLLNGRKIEDYIPALMFAYYHRVVVNGQKYQGYLPAIGQLMYISKNIKEINKLLELCHYRCLPTNTVTKGLFGHIWSSTQHDYSIWILSHGRYDGYNRKYSGDVWIISLFKG